MSNYFDIVRISSHGEFINNTLYDQNIVNNYPEKVEFNIYFRGEIGSVVLTRCNTRDTKTIKGQSYCSSFIGRSDFHKNMVINYNDNGITSASAMECSTPLIPDMLLSFDDDEFISGFALYHENGFPLECNGNYIQMRLFQKDGITQEEIKLSDVLKIIYDNMSVKTGIIDIYISSCLYIEPKNIYDIMVNYNDWFNCNRENIIIGYQNEYSSNQKKIINDETKLKGLYIYNEHLKKMNDDKQLQYYIDILNNNEVGFENFVYNYLKTNKEQIDEIEQLINEYMDSNGIDVEEDWTEDMYKQKSEEITNAVKNLFINKINDAKQKELTRKDIINNENEISKLTQSNNKLKMENLEINNAVDLIKKRNMNDEEDYEPRKKRRFGGKNLTYKLKCLDKCKCKRGRVKYKNGKYDSKQFNKNKNCEIKCNKKCYINYMRKTQKKKYKQKGGNEPIYKYMLKNDYDYDKIKELLEKGADPNIEIPGTRGQMPLFVAIHYDDNHKLFDLLMEYGGKPFLEDNLGVNVYDYVKYAPRIQSELYEKLKDNFLYYERVLSEYKKKHIPDQLKDYIKRKEYDYDKIKELLDKGYDPNERLNNAGQTPLIVSLFFDDDHKLFDLLMEYDVDPLLTDNSDNSTLDYIQIGLDGLFGPNSNIKKNADYFMEKVKEKLKDKEEASKIFQKNFRGKKTRKKKYIDRYRSYKPWKGTEAMDYYLYTDEDIFNYLREDDDNFVLKLPSTGEEKYEAWNINDILKSLKIEGNRNNDSLMFYECLTPEHNLRPENISTDSVYIKIGSVQTIVKLPEWLHKHFLYNTKVELPEPRIYTLKKYKKIFGLVSNDVYDYGGSQVSADHCNYPKSVWAYELVIDKEEDYITDFIKYVENVDIDRSNLHLNPHSTIYEWFYKYGAEDYLNYNSYFSYFPKTLTLEELYNKDIIIDDSSLIEDGYIPEDIAGGMYQEYINMITNYYEAAEAGYQDGLNNLPIDYRNFHHNHYEDGYYVGLKEHNDKMKKTSDWKGLESLHNQLGGIGSDDEIEDNYDNIDLLKDDEDAFKNYLEFLAKEDDRYTIESCKRLKNLTDSKSRLIFDPLVKSHIKHCAKFNVISNFFSNVSAENLIKDELYLCKYIINKLHLLTKEANDEGIDTINNYSISNIILSSGYYSDFSLEERRELWHAIRNFIISRNLHEEKYSKILFSLLSTYDTRGANLFRIRFMDLLRIIANNLRSINTSEETIDKMIIKFIQSLSWNKIIIYN